jgi:hypothetical protein
MDAQSPVPVHVDLTTWKVMDLLIAHVGLRSG